MATEFDGKFFTYKPKDLAQVEANLAFDKKLLEDKGVPTQPNVALQLADAYQSVFGFVAPPYPAFGLNLANRIPLRNIKQLIRAKGELGAIRSPFEVRKPTGIQGLWLMLPNEPLVQVRGKKQVVTTSISRGRDGRGVAKRGTVKEVIYMDDYDIEIDGIIIGKDQEQRAENDIVKVHNICEYGLSLFVRHDLLNLLGINMLTITDFELPTEAGEGMHVQKYKIKAISDEDFESELLTGV